MALLMCMSDITDSIEYGHLSVNDDWFHIMLCPWGYKIPNGTVNLEWAHRGKIKLSEIYDDIGDDTIIFVTFPVIDQVVTGQPNIEIRRHVAEEEIQKPTFLIGLIASMLQGNINTAMKTIDEVVDSMRGESPAPTLEMVKEVGKRRIELVDIRCEDATVIAREFFKADNIMKILAGEDVVCSSAKPVLNTKPSASNMSSSSKSGGCYVATAVYGSYDCPEVWILRRYRDDKLGSTWYGRLFIRTYYAISPTLVKWFGKTNWFQSFFRKRLDRMVKKLSERGVENTPYEDKSW